MKKIIFVMMIVFIVIVAAVIMIAMRYPSVDAEMNLEELTQEYVFDGRFEEVYDRIRSQIDGLVETDPTAFYSYEEYEAGAEMFYQTVILRAESIQGQLDGRIPATDEEQREDDAALVDASELDMSVMGVFEMGGRK